MIKKENERMDKRVYITYYRLLKARLTLFEPNSAHEEFHIGPQFR
jgi:hypothetical protein